MSVKTLLQMLAMLPGTALADALLNVAHRNRDGWMDRGEDGGLLAQKAIWADGSKANTKNPRQDKLQEWKRNARVEHESMQKLRGTKGKTRSIGEPGRRSVHPLASLLKRNPTETLC